MPIIPSGVPLWLRQNDYAVYGGNLNKTNFASRGVINPKTDLGAEAFSRMAADMAAIARVAAFCELTLICDDVTPGAPTVEYASLMTGIRTTSYLASSPPAGFPSIARNGNGDITLTFAASYTDPYGVVGAFAIKHPGATLHGATPGGVSVQIVTDSTLRVRVFDAAGAALSNPRLTVTVGSGQ